MNIYIIEQPDGNGVIFLDNQIYYAGDMAWCDKGLPKSEIIAISQQEKMESKDLNIVYKKYSQNIIQVNDLAYQVDPWLYYQKLTANINK